MPEPVPSPTEAQIVTVAEITMLSTATVAAMIAANEDQGIVDAQWARTLEDLDLWPDLRDEAGDLKRVGSIEFFENAAISSRLAFRNAIRNRYGQTALLSETGRVVSESAGFAVAIGNDW